MSIVISHPTGNEFSKAAVKGFFDKDLLQSFYTTVANFPGSVLHKLGSFKSLSEIRKRDMAAYLQPYTHTYPWKELGRQLAIKGRIGTLTKHETGFFSVDEVYKNFDRYVSKQLNAEKKKGATAVYAYEDGAFYSFKRAGELNLTRFYDLPIGYWRAMHSILAKEKASNPGWGVTLDGLKDSLEKLNRKDEELRLSEKIFVASSFTAKTLEAYPGKLSQVHITPYGFPAVNAKNYRSIISAAKIKLLFVGGLSQRKGLSYLFKAVEGFGNYFSLTIVGRLPSKECKPLNTELRKHTYIPSVPHKKILQLMHEHDILVFPSLFEGFGQVITEAMSQGTPVITTERTAGPDIIQHGDNGWLVNAGSSEALRNVLEKILLQPCVIADIGMHALETAKKRPWKVYGEELAEAVMVMDS